jgi:multidrug efflux pump subunit AcrA (membrane-fusion protein)
LVKNKDRVLLPGMSCQARVWLPAITDALAVPLAAVGDHSGTPVVTVIRDGKAHEIEVETGVETSELIEIRKGLSPGDTVATAGGYGLPDECPVQITEQL